MDVPNPAASSPLQVDFERLQAVSRAQPDVPWTVRRDRLERLRALVNDNSARIEAAISDDFGYRSPRETRIAETIMLDRSIKYALHHAPAWMTPKRMPTSLAFWPGRNRLTAQPLGVIGILAPWNFPLLLLLSPACGAIAGGNLVMLKPSEAVPSFSKLIAQLIATYFNNDEMIVCEGGADIAQAFSRLPFDHLVFTGSTAVGRLVGEAAGRNLTPVTLELGGKSPAIIDASADISAAAARIAYGKLLNAGQACVAPDYVLCPPDRIEAFATAYKAKVAAMLGAGVGNVDDWQPDYTSIASQRHYDRLQGLIDDALSKGARVEYAVEAPSTWAPKRWLPPCIITHTTPEMRVRKEEIFGPLLPIIAAANGDAAIEHLGTHDRPLALYWFGTDLAARDRVLSRTLAGGVTINDCMLHAVQDSQPFGGVGASGMGAYHGEWGFRTFSKMKPVYYRPRLSLVPLLRPPYRRRFDLFAGLFRRFA